MATVLHIHMKNGNQRKGNWEWFDGNVLRERGIGNGLMAMFSEKGELGMV